MLKFIIYATCFSLLFITALFLLKNNEKKKSTKTFSVLIITSLLWITSLWIADSTTNTNLAIWSLNIAIFFFSVVTWSLLLFAMQYTSLKSRIGKYIVHLAILFNLIYFIAAIFRKIITEVNITVHGASIQDATLLYDIHVLQSNSFAIISLIILNYKKRFLDTAQKKQVKLMTIGLVIAAVGNVFSGSVAFYVEGLEWFNLIGVLSIAIFISAIGYAIIRHKLFDIRLIIARSLAYTGSLAILGTTFVLTTFLITELILPESIANQYRLLVSTVSALVVVIIFQPSRNFFDRVTNKIFYKDAYDTQEVLSEVSNIIVGNVDPHKVQKGALRALGNALKPNYMTFLFVGVNSGVRQGDILGQHWQPGNTKQLGVLLRKTGKHTVIYDELEENSALKNELRSEDIGVIAPLITKDETIGYLVLGPKKSGNMYNSQDIGLLNIATNELAVALQNAQRFEEIQAFNITLQEKVAEATRELKQTNKKLVALDEAKDEFISMASHQLRTPLTSIKGYLSMLLEGDLGKVTQKQERALKEAFGSSQRMVYLIADFLNVSRIKTGKFMIEISEVDLPQMVREEITQLREIADSRDVNINYDPPGVFPKTKLDDNKIRQVMMNMVDNAIYYTPAGGSITIQLYVNGEDVVFKVIDTGIGVPKAEQHKLFTKFYRAGNAKKARPDGTGLGLFMAQKIVVAQGGRIIFESTEGKGSTFGFSFPLAKVKA